MNTKPHQEDNNFSRAIRFDKQEIKLVLIFLLFGSGSAVSRLLLSWLNLNRKLNLSLF